MSIRNSLTCPLPNQRRQTRKQKENTGQEKSWCLLHSFLGNALSSEYGVSNYWNDRLEVQITPYVYYKTKGKEQMGRIRKFSPPTMAEFPYATAYFWSVFPSMRALMPNIYIAE